MRRVIAIGDLNGAHDLLRAMLRGLGVIDASDRFVAKATHVIQIGDLFNRGPDARGALLFLEGLRGQATRRGSRVTVLLGNHEVMTALGNESYCTTGEYLSFATDRQRERWPLQVRKAMRSLVRDRPPGGPILPIGPRLDAWKVLNAPGRSAMRRALGPKGKLGRLLRRLPIAVAESGCVFCHAGLAPRWARLGVDGLNVEAAKAWRAAPRFFGDLDASSILHDKNGPLWNRDFANKSTKKIRRQLVASLKRLDVQRMVVGHTQTGTGSIELHHDGRLVCIDVGLGRSSSSAALVLERGQGHEWTPGGTRRLW